jgi:hypothetical protein
VNRLQLCQAVQGLARAATGALTTTPTTTTGQTGVEGEIVRFVDYAYRDLQNEQEEWLFRVKRGSFNTVASTRAYTIISSVTDYEELLPAIHCGDRYVTNYLTSAGVGYEDRMWYVPYENWQQGVFETGTRPEARPVRFTIEPDGQMAMDPTPDAIYTVNFDYRRTLHELTSDSDATTGTPIIPARYHMAIVWKALEYFAATREVPQGQRTKWERNLSRVMNELHYNQLPKMEGM